MLTHYRLIEISADKQESNGSYRAKNKKYIYDLFEKYKNDAFEL